MPEFNKTIENLNQKIKICKEYNENIYHNAHLLLLIYSDVVWQTQNDVDELEMECLRTNDQSVFSALDILTDFTPDRQFDQLSDRIKSIETTKVIIDIVNNALVKVKLFPKRGELYFDIINKCYLVKYKYSENEILEALNISRTSFYRHKKKAVNLFGVTLWGFILPKLKEQFNIDTEMELI